MKIKYTSDVILLDKCQIFQDSITDAVQEENLIYISDIIILTYFWYSNYSKPL